MHAIPRGNGSCLRGLFSDQVILGLLLAVLLAGLSPLQSWAGPYDQVTCIDEDDYTPPAQIPGPTVIPGTGLAQDIYEVATPPNYDARSPVLVFVHGLHGNAQSWLETV